MKWHWRTQSPTLWRQLIAGETYLSHLLADSASIAWFKFHAIGATMPNLNEGIIRSFPLSLPNFRYQETVAAILSDLDDKIELNRRINETLEEMVQATFRDWFVDFGPIQLLPHLFRAEVMSTNLDYLLPSAYAAAGSPFAAEFCGPDLRTAPQRIGNNPRALLRLHGQGDTTVGRVLTLAEYNQAYGEGGTLPAVLSAIIGTRSLLFMGCSLKLDRTVEALRVLRQGAMIEPPRHYAFLPTPPEGERMQRRQFLGEAEIHPIYYPAGDHDQCIEDLLITLMEGGLDG